jgi:dUTP pyrophosphatase
MEWIKVLYLNNYDLENWGPLYKKEGDVCFDLRAAIEEPIILIPGEIMWIELGIKLELAPGYGLMIMPRSGLGGSGLKMANNVGIIDNGYRGQVIVPMQNSHPYNSKVISPGDRIVQAMLVPVRGLRFLTAEDEEELSKTERGAGGFGSTGNN